MNRFVKIIFILSAVFPLVSCYGIEKENFKTLAGIDISIEEGANIYAALMEPLVLDIDIRSENDNEMTYEWAYGAKAKEGFPIMADTTFVSDKKNLDHAFNRVGDFVLRLKVDNGETIVFRYYQLRVMTGVDEGIVMLNNDDQGNSYLSFIKTRTPDEIRDDSREFWADIMKEFNPDYTLKHGNDMFLSYSAYHKSASLIIVLSDDDGSVIKMDPRTLLVTARNKLENITQGTKPLKIVGEVLIESDWVIASYAAYILGSDGDIYRYDLAGDVMAIRTDCMGLNFTKAYEFIQENSIFHLRSYYFCSKDLIICPTSSGRVLKGDIAGYDIINIGSPRNSTSIHIIARSQEDGTVCHLSGGQGFTEIYVNLEMTYDEPNLCMDENSVIVSSRQSQMAFYNYNDKIYAWNVSDYLNSRVPDTPIVLDPQLPAGEQIITLGINGNPKDDNTLENHLYIATYNPSRAGETKGSLYIYEIPEYKLVKAYEGMFHKPVKVFYKYPISL